jgi:hypothetical protein
VGGKRGRKRQHLLLLNPRLFTGALAAWVACFLNLYFQQTITMNTSERKDDPVGGNPARGEQTDTPLRIQEKTSLGGEFNSGVTSNDPAEKDEIEKKGALANIDQSSLRTEEEQKD